MTGKKKTVFLGGSGGQFGVQSGGGDNYKNTYTTYREGGNNASHNGDNRGS